MRNTNRGINKPLVYAAVAAIIVLTLIAVVPVTYQAIMNAGVQTGGISDKQAQPASVAADGQWSVADHGAGNETSIGYTFHEILPGQKRETSGSTSSVTGHVTITHNTVTPGSTITADLTSLTTDQQRRDVNVRLKLLDTENFPTASFKLTKPVPLKGVPDDGTIGTATLTGDLTIKGTTNEITAQCDVLRSGKNIVIATTVPFNRLDYGVNTPEFIAAKVDDTGELNIRVVLEQAHP